MPPPPPPPPPSGPGNGGLISSDGDGVAHLRSEAARLRAQVRFAWKQVAEMKNFLADYGLVWVGEPDHEGLAEPSSSSPSAAPGPPGRTTGGEAGGGGKGASALPPHPPEKPPAGASGPRRRVSSSGGGGGSLGEVGVSHPSPPLPPRGTAAASSSSSSSIPLQRIPLPFPLERLHAAVSELNELAGDGESRLVGGGPGVLGAVLRTPDPVRLVLFSDGLQVHRSAPKPYNDPAAWSCLKDIIDGYFPIVLKSEFPDGVPIKASSYGKLM